jgi:hypothetical protein
MKLKKIVLLPLVLLPLALAACQTGETTGHVTEATSSAKAPKGAEAKVSGTCDTDLGSGNGDDYSLTSEVHVKNTGGVDETVSLTVGFPQYGHPYLKSHKTVTLATGKSTTIRIAKHVSMAQFSRAQDAQLKTDNAELKCAYKGSVAPTA